MSRACRGIGGKFMEQVECFILDGERLLLEHVLVSDIYRIPLLCVLRAGGRHVLSLRTEKAGMDYLLFPVDVQDLFKLLYGECLMRDALLKDGACYAVYAGDGPLDDRMEKLCASSIDPLLLPKEGAVFEQLTDGDREYVSKKELELGKQVAVEHLVIEITRKCNMACPHCLRGDAQELDIREEYMDRLLDKVLSISTVTFTDGEPSLNVAAMESFLAKCKRHRIKPQGFYLATNGLAVTDRFLQACDSWDSYCMENICKETGQSGLLSYKDAVFMATAAMDARKYCESGVALSLDRFHAPIPAENIRRLMAKPYFAADKIVDERSDGGWLRMGRAEHMEPAWGPAPLGYWHGHDYSGEYGEREFENLFLNADGALLYSCDLSYDKQETLAYAHVLDEDWPKAVAESSHRQYAQAVEEYRKMRKAGQA